MLRLLKSLVVLVLMSGPLAAQSLSDQDRDSFRQIITGQIDAFRADDGPRAYGYAAPIIKQIFSSPETFMSMVKRGYQPVYRPQSFRFGEAGADSAGRPVQRVTIVGPDGLTYEAVYTMERQPDGSWQISGCAIVRAPELGV